MRILICEDSALLREGLVRLLQDAGHEVVAALPDADGIAGAVRDTAPELCILDVRLPPTFTDEGIEIHARQTAIRLTCRKPPAAAQPRLTRVPAASSVS